MRSFVASVHRLTAPEREASTHAANRAVVPAASALRAIDRPRGAPGPDPVSTPTHRYEVDEVDEVAAVVGSQARLGRREVGVTVYWWPVGLVQV